MTDAESTSGERAPDEERRDSIQAPPESIGGILRQLGPGLIIAGAIVGSGELIATTKTGAQAGFWLLWLIVIGCVIKLFTQVEFGRYAISSGKTTMSALNEVPGPRLRVNWVLWYWLVMFIVTLAQLGGIVGGVGQSLAMSLPLGGDFNRLLDEQDAWDRRAGPIRTELHSAEAAELAADEPAVRNAAADRVVAELDRRMGSPRPDWSTKDDVWWAAIVTVITVLFLVNGRYAMIQSVAMVLVAAFTAVTIFNLVALQSQPDWAVGWGDLKDGLSFKLPPSVANLARSPLATALATFGIIGVGANELITYPYWCLEKGYARFTGPRDETSAWVTRAQGWMRVMRWDACISMLIFTFATVAFYLLGAAVLYPNLDPEGNQMIRTLGEMYRPVFGDWAKLVFLFGAFAVLYSTFFVANAGHARVAADAVRVFRVGALTDRSKRRWVRGLCVVFPTFSFLVYAFIRAPVGLVLAGGVAQAVMLPVLGAATLWFRYRRCDQRIAPGRLWDVALWVSVAGVFVAGVWLALMKLFPSLEQLG